MHEIVISHVLTCPCICLSLVTSSDVHSHTHDTVERRTQLINFYFHSRVSYNDILAALALRDGMIINKRDLLRILKDSRLSRWKDNADLGHVIDFIQEQSRVRARCIDIDGCLQSAKKMG